jgi:hypothetical protein
MMNNKNFEKLHHSRNMLHDRENQNQSKKKFRHKTGIFLDTKNIFN